MERDKKLNGIIGLLSLNTWGLFLFSVLCFHVGLTKCLYTTDINYLL